MTIEAAGSTKILVSVTLCPTSNCRCGHLFVENEENKGKQLY